MLRDRTQRYFICALLLLCFSYLISVLLFNAFGAFSVDEFWFAHRAYFYKDHLPYRDFSPYKTVLGYYLLLLPMLKTQGVIHTLIATKNFLAYLNLLILFSCALWLTRYFSRSAVLISLTLLIFSELMIVYSTNIRVDLPAYWCCLIALLLLFEKRFFVAGVCIGLGFVISQKASWCLVATNCALAIACIESCGRLKKIQSIFLFNLAAMLVITVYCVYWTYVSSWHFVLNNVFLEAAAMYQCDWYKAAQFTFWRVILTNNPFLFFLLPLSMVSTFLTYMGDNHYQERRFIVIYTFIILLCLIHYQQIFPYYMQIFIPFFLVLNAAYSDWLFAVLSPGIALKPLIKKPYIFLFLCTYTVLLLITIIRLELPMGYCLMSLFPLCLCYQIFSQATYTFVNRQFIIIVSLFMGFIYPFALVIAHLDAWDGRYQKANIVALNSIVKEEHGYFAGVDFLYDSFQPITGLRHLPGAVINYLYQPSVKLRPLMLDSIDANPNVTTATILNELMTTPTIAYINNYRLHAIPPALQSFLATHYSHWQGSIYLYAPYIPHGQHKFDLKFSGFYLIDSSDNAIFLNGITYLAAKKYFLSKGVYYSYATHACRLKWQPQHTLFLKPSFKMDRWKKMTL